MPTIKMVTLKLRIMISVDNAAESIVIMVNMLMMLLTMIVRMPVVMEIFVT